MIRIFIISAIRNLRKDRLSTTIDALGLALGVACCLVIFVIANTKPPLMTTIAKASRIF